MWTTRHLGHKSSECPRRKFTVHANLMDKDIRNPSQENESNLEDTLVEEITDHQLEDVDGDVESQFFVIHRVMLALKASSDNR